MKKIFILGLAILVIALASCDKPDVTMTAKAEALIGDKWEIVTTDDYTLQVPISEPLIGVYSSSRGGQAGVNLGEVKVESTIDESLSITGWQMFTAVDGGKDAYLLTIEGFKPYSTRQILIVYQTDFGFYKNSTVPK